MRKILNIIGKRPVGGIGAFVYNYQCHFSKAIQVDYLIFSDEMTGDFDKKVAELGSDVFVLPELRNLRLFELWYKINKFMKEHGREYIAVHLHSVNIAFMCLPSAKRYGIKHLIVHSHSTIYSDKVVNAIRNRLLCYNLMKISNIYMACSNAASDFLYGKNNRSNVYKFNNAIDCEKFKFSKHIRELVRNEYGWNEKFIIGNVGRICNEKNQIFLLDVFKECLKLKPNAILILVGDGEKKKVIEEKVNKYKIKDKVFFLGRRDDVERLLQAMDVFVLPSLFEGLPVIGVEAQASGLHMVVSDVVTKELDIIGLDYLSLNEDKKIWAKIIVKCKNDKREDCYKAVINAGYDIRKEADRLEKFYMNLK